MTKKMFNETWRYSEVEFYAVLSHVFNSSVAELWRIHKKSNWTYNMYSIDATLLWSTMPAWVNWIQVDEKLKARAKVGDIDIDKIVNIYIPSNGMLVNATTSTNARQLQPWVTVWFESYEARRLRKKEEEKILRKNDEAKALRKAVKEMGDRARQRIMDTVKAMEDDFTQITNGDEPEELIIDSN